MYATSEVIQLHCRVLLKILLCIHTICAEIYVTWLDLTKAYILSNKQEVKSAETCVLAFFYVNSNALFIIIFCYDIFCHTLHICKCIM